jgi:hypothetical protein
MQSYRNRNKIIRDKLITTDKRYLICFIVDGFNDILSEIDRCYNYCLKYNRILVIDSSKNWFKEDIREYINFDSPIIYKGSNDELYEILNKNTIYPEFLKDAIKRFNPIRNTNNCSYYANRRLIDSNLNSDCSAVTKVYIEAGRSPHNILNICSFNPFVLNIFRERYDKLPKDYISVHIRNTDLKSNVDDFLNKYKEELVDKSIFLATDHAPTILKFKEIFGSNIYSFANVPDNNGKNIHENHELIPTRQFNIDCLTDLLLLAAGSKLYLSIMTDKDGWRSISGYANLALEIHKNKKLFSKLTSY